MTIPAERCGLRFGALEPETVHLCVDMQVMFADPASPWHAPWMGRVLPNVLGIVRAHPERTIFTRFMPLPRPEAGRGAWRRYYHRWREMTREEIDPAWIEIVPSLTEGLSEAEVIDKTGYGPWFGTTLDARLARRETQTLVVTGGESDVCVLGAVMGAVDRGFRVVVVADAICSSSDTTHDAILRIFADRFSQQIELVMTGALLESWI